MSLRNDTLYNVLGAVAPAVAALVTIPLLLAKIGEVRFGVLALVWLLLGHFGVFDFGLSRATANRIARVPADDVRGRREVFWTSLWMNLAFGLAGAASLYLLAEPLMAHVFEIGATAREEILPALPWVAVAVPLATLAGVLGGALDGRERFDVVNGLQALGAVIVQAAPVVAAYTVAIDLQTLIAASVMARGLSMLLLFAANLRLVAPGGPLPPERRHARALFGYGAWVSISALIVPFFMTLDKFMIGAMLGAAAVAYYSVPDQLVRRISVFPGALARSIFPRISAADEHASRELAARSTRVLIAVVTPAVVALIAAMHPFLTLWIDADFAARASAPGVLLAAGIWLNSLAMIPSAYLQASGRPDITAKCHLLEILPHAVILWLCIRLFGAVGAAAAMLIVTVMDTVLLMIFARLHVWRMAAFWTGAAWIGAAAIVGLGDYAARPWLYAVALGIVLASTLWAWRTSPDLAAAVVAFQRRLTLPWRARSES